MSSNTSSPSAKAIALLLVLSIIWGTSFILIKQGLKVFGPQELGALRVSLATLMFLPVALVRVRELNTGDHFKLFASGLMGIFIPAFLFALAQQHLNSSLAGILNTLSPVWTMVIGAAVFGQRFRAITITGIAISFAGTLLLALTRSGDDAISFNSYALLIVFACALYGANLNWIKFKVHHLSTVTIVSVSLLLVGPLAIIYLLGMTPFLQTMQHEPGAWSAFGFIFLLALMSTAVANLLFYQLLQISSPLFASSVTYIMPLVAVLWGLLDGEQLSLGHLAGMICILGGVYLANRR
jgi:drug/metabolite transporter (DMT)-like permease